MLTIRPLRPSIVTGIAIAFVGSSLAGAWGQAVEPPGRQGAGVVDTSKSPSVKLRPVPIRAVRMKDGFWLPRMEANRLKGIPRLLELLEHHGVVDNYRRISGRKTCDRRGPFFTDSDLYKWMEASAFVLESVEDASIRQKLNAIIDEVVAIQGKDGYLNTYFVDERAGRRFSNLAWEHELYCAGHMFQAAVAHYRATGERKLLDAAVRYADYMTTVFGPGKIEQADGHPEVEMALVELYRTTGKRAYLDLSGFFTDVQKFTGMKSIEGHAVRAAYRCCGAVDYYAETGKPAYLEASERLWRDMVGAKIYITGGIGAKHGGEAFGGVFELPNDSSYAETCAGIAAIMWNWRMLGVTGEARFADWMETGLYNGFLSGVSLSGTEYFYVNPLESAGGHKRQEWYSCTCCPPNVQRTFAAFPGYLYSTSTAGLWVHFYDNNELTWQLEDGTKLKVTQDTRYPWDGKVVLTIVPEKAAEFSVFVRIPGWCGSPSATVNATPVEAAPKPGTYCEIRRLWKPDDRVELTLPMPVVAMTTDPRVRDNRGRLALARGPVVYCLESVDNPGTDVLNAIAPTNLDSGDPRVQVTPKRDLLGGVTELTFDGKWLDYAGTSGPLYRPAKPAGLPVIRKATLRAIPYYAWANRGDSKMIVWMWFDLE